MPLSNASLSRRGFFRFAAGASALAALPIVTEADLARAQEREWADPSKGIHIDANENPLGPCASARQAAHQKVENGGRYYFNLENDLAALFAKQEGLDPSYVRVYAGSSEPLAYTVLAFTNASRPLVVADPGYEAAGFAAKRAGAQSIPVALADPRGAAMHDIKTMMSAAANPGVVYICNPNNPTGTCTPRADLEHAAAAAKGDTVLLIDEAYIHFCDAPRSLDFVKEGRNVIVLRTFSKLYGMAGLRMGFAIGRPDLLKKLDYFGRNFMPTTAVAAAIASLNEPDLIETRKKIVAGTCNDTLAWAKSEGYFATPSESNCFMLDTRRPAKEVHAALAARDMYVGRIWPAWPTFLRITVGTPDEMRAFRQSFTEVTSRWTSPSASVRPNLGELAPLHREISS